MIRNWIKKSEKENCMNRVLLIALVFIMPFCLSSCSLQRVFGKKKTEGKDTTVAHANADSSQLKTTLPQAVITPKKDTVAPAMAVSAATRLLIDSLAPIWAKRLTYNTFKGKAKMNIEGPNGSLELIANFKIRKDSIIWVHVTALGGLVPAARILVTRDSFFMLNYQEKEVTTIALKDAVKILPTAIDFRQLQNLIVGEPLRDGKITDAESLQALWNMTVEDSNYVQHITFTKADSTMSAEKMTTQKPGGPQAGIDFSNYEQINGRKISTYRSVHVLNGDKAYSIDLNFVNSQFDEELEYQFSIPRNWTIKNPNP